MMMKAGFILTSYNHLYAYIIHQEARLRSRGQTTLRHLQAVRSKVCEGLCAVGYHATVLVVEVDKFSPRITQCNSPHTLVLS